MAIARTGTSIGSTSGGSVTNTVTVTLASTTVGVYNVVWVSANTSGATSPDPAISTPSGWTLLGGQWKTGSPSHRLNAYGKFFVAGDGDPVFTISANGNISAGCVAYTGVDTTTPVVTGEASFLPQPSSSASWSTGTLATGGSRWILAGLANRSSGTWSAQSDTVEVTQATASAANLTLMDSNGLVAGGTVAARTGTFSVATSVGNTGILALNPASGGAALTANPADAVGATDAVALIAEQLNTDPVGITDSATASLTSAGAATPADPVGIADAVQVVQSRFVAPADSLGITDGISLQTPIVQQLLSGAIQYAAHRNGTYATYGEETLEGYQAADAQYSKALLEISVWDTSDGVYVCSHDQTTGRVFSGTNRTITSTTWATFSPNGSSTAGRPTTLVGGNPMRRLEEILDALPGTFFIVENKHGTNQATLSTLLDAHAPGHWMFKGPYNDTANAVTAAGHGAPMWLYFYPSQLGSLSTSYSAVSGSGVPIVFGLGDYSTAPVPVQSDANTFFSFTTSNGLMAWAHILGTTPQKTTADGQASTAGTALNGYMVSSYPTLAPSDANSPADPVGVTDAAATASTAQKTPADAVGLTDTATASAGYAASGADNLGLTDSATAVASYAPQVPDAVGVADAVIAANDAVRTAADTAGITDDVTAGIAATRSATDQVGLSDAALTAASYTQQAADIEGLTDAAAVASDTVRAANDPAGVTDSTAAVLDAARNAPDQLGLSDAAQTAAGYGRQPADPVSGTDSVTVTYSYSQTVNDPVGLTDSVSVVLPAAGSVTVADPVGATDTVSTAVVYVQQPTDSVGLTDSVTVQIMGGVLAAELIGLSDAAAAAAGRMAGAVDGVGLTDSALAIITPEGAGPDLIYSVFTGQDRWHVTTGSSRWTVTTGAVE